MKMRVLYLDSANLDVEVWDEHELNEDGWAGYWDAMQYGCLDDIDINYDDIDKKVYVVSYGGELFKLNDGRWMNICWRGASCHIWEEHDSDTLETIKGRLG